MNFNILKEQNINILDASEYVRSKNNKDKYPLPTVKEIKPDQIQKTEQNLSEKFGWIEGIFNQ